MRREVLRTGAAATMALLVELGGAIAWAQQQPAVSAPNGKISVLSGAVGANGSSSAVGLFQGSLTAPLGQSFGIQADLVGATAYSSFGGGGTLHAFWRDPSIGLFGPIAAIGGGRGSRVGFYGAEAEYYMGPVTLAGTGGYQDFANYATLYAMSSGFFTGRLTVYPMPDLAVAAEGRSFFGQTSGRGIIEYQPDFVLLRGLSLVFDGEAGPGSFFRVTGGLRFYFGSDKPLIRRHREDDPSELSVQLPVYHVGETLQD